MLADLGVGDTYNISLYMATEVKEGRRLVYLPLSSLVCTPTIHNTKKRRRALRALFPAKSLKLRGLFLANKSKEASTCRTDYRAIAGFWNLGHFQLVISIDKNSTMSAV